MHKGFAALVGLIAMCGCASQETIRARQAALAAAQETQDDSNCRSYGVAPGTEGYLRCRMTLKLQRDRMAMHDQELQQRRSEALMATGIAIMNSR